MSGTQDFTITKKGVLTEYIGPGGDVVIPEGVTEIGRSAFCGCTGLTSVTIPKGVTKIGCDAFCACKKLQSVVIPESVTEIESYAFGECKSLQSVTIPKSVRAIGRSAFTDCENLQSVTFRDRKDAVGIEVELFGNCDNITNVVIPRCIAKIAHVLFEGTPWLKSLGEFAILDHFLIKYQGESRDVVIPEEVEELGWYSFASCKSVRNVTIPEGIAEIGHGTFRNCPNLQSVTIPKSVEEIDKSVFEGSSPMIVAPHIPVGDFAPKNKPGACAGFAKLYLEQAELDEEIKADYLKYIKGQKKKLYPVAIRHQELLQLMFAEKMIPRKDIDPLLEECDRQNNVAAKAAVLEYAGKNLKPVDPLKESS